MRTLAAILIAALPAAAEPLHAPSGQPLRLADVLWDEGDPAAPVLRLRLVAPEIGTSRSFADVEADFLHICRAVALPRLPPDVRDAIIVINLSDRVVPFGATDPDATQYFEAFAAVRGDCVWQGL